MTAPTRVDQVDSNPGILATVESAGVLTLDADGVHTLLHAAGLIDHQHRLVIVQVLHHVATHVVAYPVGALLGPADQVLHAVRSPSPAHSEMVQQFLQTA